MLDEMAIKKHVSWDGYRYRGYVDIGTSTDDNDCNPVAKDALVFMVVAMNSSWKVPCAYFFIDGMTGCERANLIRICVSKLHDVGIVVASLTCDGPSCHFSMFSELGACLDPSMMKTYFDNPAIPEKRIHIFLDVCHILKLLRNTLGEAGILIDGNGGKIQWQYILELQKLQQKEGLRLGNKLKLTHVNWQQEKMKVNLAAQTFSASVADALEYCSDVLKLREFWGCAATVKFIRMVDQLFDILNSRNPLAKGFKSALRIANKAIWDPFLTKASHYFLSLKSLEGQVMYRTRRKTGFIGFLVAIHSIKGLFHDLVEMQHSPLSYLLTYKLSQDNLELFFAAIRSAGGFNNNPTAQQFTASYKRLLMRSSIAGGRGNCVPRDKTSILDIIDDTCRVNGNELAISTTSMIKKYDLICNLPDLDQEIGDCPMMTNLTDYKKAAISYIAGYVGSMTEKQTICFKCCQALGSRNLEATHSFLRFKDRGGLFKPSESVVTVCEETERKFQRMLNATNNDLPRGTHILSRIVYWLHFSLILLLSKNNLDIKLALVGLVIRFSNFSSNYNKFNDYFRRILLNFSINTVQK